MCFIYFTAKLTKYKQKHTKKGRKIKNTKNKPGVTLVSFQISTAL